MNLRTLPTTTVGLLGVVAWLILVIFVLTSRHNAQLRAQTQVHNAQIVKQAEVFNAQLKAQAEAHNAQMVSQATEFQSSHQRSQK
jgi:cell division protein FtsB